MIGTITFVELGGSVMLLLWVAHMIQGGVTLAFGVDRQGFPGTGAERHLGCEHQTAGNLCRVKTLEPFPTRLLRLGGSSARQTSKARAQAGPFWSDWALDSVPIRRLRLTGGSAFLTKPLEHVRRSSQTRFDFGSILNSSNAMRAYLCLDGAIACRHSVIRSVLFDVRGL